MNRFLSSLFLFSLLACPLFAEDPPATAVMQDISFKDTVGIVNYFKSDDIPDGAAQTISNGDYSLDGTFHSRHAFTHIFNYSQFNTTLFSVSSGPRDDGFWVWTTTVASVYGVARTERKITAIRMDSNGAKGYVEDFSDRFQYLKGRVDAIKTNGSIYFVSESSPLIYINENNPANPTNPTFTVIVVSGSPSGFAIKPHLDRFLIIGSTRPNETMTVYFSSQSRVDLWPKVNWFNVFGEGDEALTCIGDPIFGNGPLYTDRSVRLITGTVYPDEESAGNINVRTISTGLGCASQKSVKNIRNKQNFFSYGQGGKTPGIYEFNGVSVRERTKGIRRYFQSIVQASTGAAPTAFVYKDQYCLSVATNPGSVPFGNLSTIVCLDENDRATFYDNINMVMSDVKNTTLYFLWDLRIQHPEDGTSTSYRIMQFDTGDYRDDPFLNNPAGKMPISWRYKTKDFTTIGGKYGHNIKNPERAYFQADRATASVVNIIANFDYGASTASWSIDLSTIHKTMSGGYMTVENGSTSIIDKLAFPAGKKFTHVNFEIFGSSPVSMDYIHFYATPDPIP